MKLVDPEKIRMRRAELLDPHTLDTLHALEHIVEPKPNFVGPGPWIRLLTKETTDADHRNTTGRR